MNNFTEYPEVWCDHLLKYTDNKSYSNVWQSSLKTHKKLQVIL